VSAGIDHKTFTVLNGFEFLKKKVELCEDKIWSDLLKREILSADLPYTPEITIISQELSKISFAPNKQKKSTKPPHESPKCRHKTNTATALLNMVLQET
jgi:hypothetical protein